MAGEIIRSPQGGGVDVTFAQQRLARTAGNLSGFADVIDQAQRKICKLYNKSPSSLVTVVPIGEIFSPGRGILDNTCQDIEPLPPLPVPPFTGGQCPISYDVNVVLRARVIDNGNEIPVTNNTTTICQGDILSVFTRDVGEASSSGVPGGRLVQVLAHCRGTNNPVSFPSPAGYVTALLGGSQPAAYVSHSTSVTPRDGAVDNCGNPPVLNPPPLATIPDMEGTTVVNIRPNVPITVPIKIVPTFAPVTNIFRPEFNVEVGGINVNISLGGFTLSSVANIPVNINVPFSDPRGTGAPSPTAIAPPCESAPPANLSPVIDLLNKVRSRQEECCEDLKPAEDDDPTFINKTVSTLSLESATVTLPDGTYKVRVLLVERSPKERIQSGGTEADVIYAGWGWFGSGFSLAERLPIDSVDKQFVPPNSLQNSFTFTCYVGYKAICTVYYKEKR